MTGLPDIHKRLEGTLAAITWIQSQSSHITRIGKLLVATLDAGGLVMTAGNGGSAAEAMHFAEELIGRYRSNRPPRRAMCLNADPTALTCIANDFGFEQVFARQVQGLAKPEDIVFGFSTSGNSPNITRMLETARGMGCKTVGLLGRQGGASVDWCDESLVVPSADSAHVQEAHLTILHLLCEFLEPLAG